MKPTTMRANTTDKSPFTSENWSLRQLNRLTRGLGLAVVPFWRLRRAPEAPTFVFRGLRLPYFIHSYNCGYPPWRMTERSLELAIADHWLSKVDPSAVTEIGAVTPYYWPGRIGSVVDPYDRHPLIRERRSMFEVDVRGRDILAISTLEHIGIGDYGPSHDGETAEAALERLCTDAERLLVTVPFGVNSALDRLLFSPQRYRPDVRQSYLTRLTTGNDWTETDVERSHLRYSTSFEQNEGWASSVVVLDRGDVF